MFAAHAGGVAIVESFLSYGSDSKAIDLAGYTIAHYASTSDHLEALYVLKDKDIYWNAKANPTNIGFDRRIATVLHLATSFLRWHNPQTSARREPHTGH